VTKVKIIFKGGDDKDTLVGGPPADTLIDSLGPDKFICGQRKERYPDRSIAVC
jgi:hypothetical protein